MRRHRGGHVYKRGNYYWIKYHVNGRPIYESTGATTKREAEDFLAIRLGEKAKGTALPRKLDSYLYDELSSDLRQHYDTTGKRNIKEANYRLAHLDRFFHGYKAAKIGPTLITEYIAHRQQQGVSNRTINIELAVLKRMLNLAYKSGKLLRVPPIEMLKEAPPRSGFFEEEAYRTVLHHLPPDLQPIATFSYLTGWRVHSEILPLTWPQVDFRGGVIRLEPGMGKTGEPRTFPMIPELRALLEAQRAYTDRIQREKEIVCRWVFHRDGEPIKYFRRSWKTACKKAGQPGRIPHDFRRTAVRNMVRAGIPERVAMTLTGHKTRSVFERYNIVSEGDLWEAGKKLAKHFPTPVDADGKRESIVTFWLQSDSEKGEAQVGTA